MTRGTDMTKPTMPEPVAQQIRYFDSNTLSRTYGEWSEWKMFTGKYERMGMNQKRELITTDQAEAYADARVREVLEEAAALCDRFAERDMHPEECAGAIRLLITKEKT